MSMINPRAINKIYRFRIGQNNNTNMGKSLKLIEQITTFFVAGSEFSYLFQGSPKKELSKNMFYFGLVETNEDTLSVGDKYRTFIEIQNLSKEKEIRFVDFARIFNNWEINLFSAFYNDYYIISLKLENYKKYIQTISSYFKNNVLLVEPGDDYPFKPKTHEFDFDVDPFSLSTLYLKPIRYSFSYQFSIINNYVWGLYSFLKLNTKQPLSKDLSNKNKNLLEDVSYVKNALGNFLLSLIGLLINLQRLSNIYNSVEIVGKDEKEFINKYFDRYFPFISCLALICHIFKKPSEINKLISRVLKDLEDLDLFLREINKIFYGVYSSSSSKYSDLGAKIIELLIKRSGVNSIFMLIGKMIFGYYNNYYLPNIKKVFNDEKKLDHLANTLSIKVLKIVLSEQLNLATLFDLYELVRPNIVFILYTTLTFGKRFILEKIIKDSDVSNVFNNDKFWSSLSNKNALLESLYFIPIGTSHYNEIVPTLKYIEKIIILNLARKIKDNFNNKPELEIDSERLININFEIFNFLQGNNLLVTTDYILTRFIEEDLRNKNLLLNKIKKMMSNVNTRLIGEIRIENHFAV